MSGLWSSTALRSATGSARGASVFVVWWPRAIWALKPQTYMNCSGESVQPALAFYKLPVDAVTVFYDELDLAPGKVRVKRAGGAAGHNGLRSIDRMLGSPDYWRVRVGIGHPGVKERVTGHVLGDFSKQDQEWVPTLLDGIADAAPLLVAGQPEAFMTKVALVAQQS